MKKHSSIMVLATLLTYVCQTNTDLLDIECPEYCHCQLILPESSSWEIDCSESNLTLTPLIRRSSKVHILNLNRNRLALIRSFPAIYTLRTLKISENLLTIIYKNVFDGLVRLWQLDLSFNHINYVDPDAFVDNIELYSLKLQGNRLNRVNSSFLHAPLLSHLNLANCHLTNMSSQFFTQLNGLSTIDLSGNPLNSIPTGLFYPIAALKHLSLNNCNIAHFSILAFNSFWNLGVLELAENHFKNNVDWTTLIGSLNKLEHLNLRQSEISSLPKNVFSKNSLLKELILAENELLISDLAYTLGSNLNNLDFLDLSYCNMTGPLPEYAFANATKLQNLILSGNHLLAADLAVILPYLINLSTLSLSDCQLTHLPVNALRNLSHLQKLDVSKNPLKDLSEFSYIFDKIILSKSFDDEQK